MTRETLLSWMQEGKVAGKDFVLVDLRRTDFEVCLTPDSNMFLSSFQANLHGDHENLELIVL